LVEGTVAATDDTTGTFTLAASLGTSKEIKVAGAAGSSYGLIGGTPTQSTTTATNSIVRVATGGSVTLKATTYDQFAGAMANQTVNISVTGRNAAAAVARASDSVGQVSITITDGATATGSSSTVTFAGAAGTSSTTTIYWGTVTVGTVTVTGGASEDDVAYPAVGATTASISTGATGAAATYTTFTATVKDASGNLISGVPVTWTVDKATAGIVKTTSVDYASCITGTAGTCTTRVYAWEAPMKVTATATAGDKTGTGYQNFVNAAADARVLSATASGNIVTAKIVDRYGNVVSGVTVTATTSKGYFGAGATSVSGTTGSDGTVGFVVLGNDAAEATVTVKVDSTTYAQTDDLAGYVGATAVTAAVAGTSTGVGASLSPAGVNSTTATVAAATNAAKDAAEAASDAAAEAIDAANAATDAANLAAEAADAATVAAEEARDAADAATAAVEELATQVATLMAALKAQITTLANTVAKIAKKVKA
jgi:hypothetical protein